MLVNEHLILPINVSNSLSGIKLMLSHNKSISRLGIDYSVLWYWVTIKIAWDEL
jgi:hypothetical protein